MSFGATPFRPLTSRGGQVGFRGAQSLPAVTPLQGLRLAYEGGSRGQIGNIISRPFGAAANTNNATLAVTEAGDTLSSASTLAIAAALAVTEAGDTLASAGTLALAATATITEAADTVASASALGLAATAAITEVGDTLSSAETLSSTATAAITEADDGLSATATMGLAATTTTITAAGAGGVLGVGEKPAAVRKVTRKAIPTRAVANTATPPLAEAVTPLPALYLGALLRTPDQPTTIENPATDVWGIAEDEAEIEMLLLLAA